MTLVTIQRTTSVRIGRGSGDFQIARGAGVGSSIDSGSVMYLLTQRFLGTYAIWRNFMSYNTGGSIPSNAVITAATFNIYIWTKNIYHDLTTQGVLTQSSQATPTSPNTADYDNIILDDPVEAGRFDLDSVSVWKIINFSEESLSWIKRAGEQSNNASPYPTEGYTLLCLRADKDVSDTAPVFLGCNIGFLNLFYPPYLTVTYNTATLFDSVIEDGTIEG